MTHLALILAFIALQAAETAEEPAELAMVAIGSGSCEAPASGPGSSPDEAIQTDLHELMAQARWRAENFDFIEYFFDYESEDAIDLNCKWVRLQGHFRAETYWHYQGRMFADLWDTYNFSRTGYGSEPLPRLYVESFSDSSQRKFPLHSTNIAVTGFHYDLCESARSRIEEVEQEGVIVFNFGGPCHYGPTNGVMLQDVRVDELLSPINLHLSGRSAQSLIGDMTIVDSETEEYAETHTAALEWVTQLKTGERSYLLWKWGSESDFLQDRLNDANDWSSYLTHDIRARIDTITPDTQFTVFRHQRAAEYPDEPYEPSYSETIGCFCLKDSCQEEDWPVLQADTNWHSNSYLCGDFSNRDGSWRYR